MLVVAVTSILLGLVIASAWAGLAGVRTGRDQLARYYLRYFRRRHGRKPSVRRLKRVRHLVAAPAMTAMTGFVALCLTVLPLRHATIPFAPGTAFWPSLGQASLLAMGCGCAIGLYLVARRFAERRAHEKGRAPAYRRPTMIADLMSS